MSIIRTADEAIIRLGGTAQTARRFGVRASAVSNWRTRGIPGHWHLRVARELDALGVPYDADALFGLAGRINEKEGETS